MSAKLRHPRADVDRSGALCPELGANGPAHVSWVGTQPALELLNHIGIGAVYEHDVALANRFRAGLGLEPSDSAIVSVEIAGGAERLERAGIVAALRGGRLRASWHVYNTAADVDAALAALAAPSART